MAKETINARKYLEEGFDQAVNYRGALAIIDQYYPDFVEALQGLCDTVNIDGFTDLKTATLEKHGEFDLEEGPGTRNTREYLANALQSVQAALFGIRQKNEQQK